MKKRDIKFLIFNFYRWINFKHGPNSLGIQQPACNGCGNCLSGCNTGAKNTLNLNYLADAKAHGAHIFTEVCPGGCDGPIFPFEPFC